MCGNNISRESNLHTIDYKYLFGLHSHAKTTLFSLGNVIYCSGSGCPGLLVHNSEPVQPF